MTLHSADELQLVDFPSHGNGADSLVVMEPATGVPFPIARVFVVTASTGERRGHHAHRRCAQLMVCLHGAVGVTGDDGETRRNFRLAAGHQGLLVPPSIWAEQAYLEPESVLMVLCDRPYEAEDYIRDFDAFLRYRQDAGKLGTP